MIKPMKAPSKPITDDQIKKLLENGPLIGSPKLDGFRGFVDPDEIRLLSNSRKPFPNAYLQETLSKECYAGLDGELIVGEPNDPNVFAITRSPLSTKKGSPDFNFYVFDLMLDPTEPYEDRQARLADYAHLPHVVILECVFLRTFEDVLLYEEKMLLSGYEGIMLRDPQGVYKFGRATLREGNIFKRKPFTDAEARILDTFEQMENTNEKVVNEMGRSSRSSSKDGKVGKGTLGGFVLKCDLWEEPFHCGTMLGTTAEQRQELWNRREELNDDVVTFKFQLYGSIDGPRIPVILRFRPKWDLSE